MPFTLDYYYGNEAEQYSFYRIPKLLFTDSRFRGISVEAKVLYGLLLDRMSLSVRNGWMDGDGRVYIIFTIADVMETLACAEQKANRLLSELDTAKGVGLIERKRRGLGKPNVIYVKNFTTGPQAPPRPTDAPGPPTLPGQADKVQQPGPPGRGSSSVTPANRGHGALSEAPASNQGQEIPSMPPAWHGQEASPWEEMRQEPANLPDARDRPQELQESQIQNCENHKSGNVKTTNQELRKSQSNNTDFSNTEMSGTDPSINPQARAGGTGRMDKTGKMDLFQAYCELIRENISYGILLERCPYERERLDGFVELMAEVCCSSRETTRVNQQEMSTELVKSRFLKLDSSHIGYVMDCLDKNTTLVGNIRAYTLSALFNAPVTISQYYASLVRHDLANGFGGG